MAIRVEQAETVLQDPYKLFPVGSKYRMGMLVVEVVEPLESERPPGKGFVRAAIHHGKQGVEPGKMWVNVNHEWETAE